MKKKYSFFILFFISLYSISGQGIKKDTIKPKYTYPFSLINGQDLFTMQQTNQNYLSTYRLAARLINKKPSRSDIFVLGGLSFLGVLITRSSKSKKRIAVRMSPDFAPSL